MRGSSITARASAVRCFWPPDSVMPRSPTDRVVALGKFLDVLVEPRDRGRGAHARVRDAGGTVRHRRRRTRCSRRSCRRRGTAPAARSRSRRAASQRNLADVDAVDEDRARRRLVQPRQQVDQRRLAGAGGADERRGLPGLDPQRHVVEHRRLGAGIREGQVADLDAAAHRRARGPPAVTPASSMSGTASSTSSIRFHDAMPRCRMLVTQPNAIIGQRSITR